MVKNQYSPCTAQNDPFLGLINLHELERNLEKLSAARGEFYCF